MFFLIILSITLCNANTRYSDILHKMYFHNKPFLESYFIKVTTSNYPNINNVSKIYDYLVDKKIPFLLLEYFYDPFVEMGKSIFYISKKYEDSVKIGSICVFIDEKIYNMFLMYARYYIIDSKIFDYPMLLSGKEIQTLPFNFSINTLFDGSKSSTSIIVDPIFATTAYKYILRANKIEEFNALYNYYIFCEYCNLRGIETPFNFYPNDLFDREFDPPNPKGKNLNNIKYIERN